MYQTFVIGPFSPCSSTFLVCSSPYLPRSPAYLRIVQTMFKHLFNMVQSRFPYQQRSTTITDLVVPLGSLGADYGLKQCSHFSLPLLLPLAYCILLVYLSLLVPTFLRTLFASSLLFPMSYFNTRTSVFIFICAVRWF